MQVRGGIGEFALQVEEAGAGDVPLFERLAAGHGVVGFCRAGGRRLEVGRAVEYAAADASPSEAASVAVSIRARGSRMAISSGFAGRLTPVAEICPLALPSFIFLSPLGERLGEGGNSEDCLLHHPLTQPLPQGGEEHERKSVSAPDNEVGSTRISRRSPGRRRRPISAIRRSCPRAGRARAASRTASSPTARRACASRARSAARRTRRTSRRGPMPARSGGWRSPTS